MLSALFLEKVRFDLSSSRHALSLTDPVLTTVYRKIFSLAHGYWTFPFLLLSLAAQQGAQVVGSYALVWWQEDAFNQPMGFCESFGATDLHSKF